MIVWLHTKNICSTTFRSKGSHINKKIQSALKKNTSCFILGQKLPEFSSVMLKIDLGVSKNRGGPPKWMVKIMENWLKWMIWGKPTIFGNIHIFPHNPQQMFPPCIEGLKPSFSWFWGPKVDFHQVSIFLFLVEKTRGTAVPVVENSWSASWRQRRHNWRRLVATVFGSFWGWWEIFAGLWFSIFLFSV